MRLSIKLLLTIPSFITLFYVLAISFPGTFFWLFPSMTAYYIQVAIANGLNLLVLGVLLRKLWKIQYVDRRVKVNWTWFLLLLGTVASLIFIWKTWDALDAAQNTQE